MSCLQRILAIQSLCYPDLQRVPLILVYLCDFQRGNAVLTYRPTVVLLQLLNSLVFHPISDMLSRQEAGAVYAARMLVAGDRFQCAYICVRLDNR